MKKIICIVAVIGIAIAVCIASCVDRHKTLSVKDYNYIWNDSNVHTVEEEKLFPKSIDSLNVKKFSAEEIVYAPTGMGYQVLLEVEYDKDDFDAELARIKSIGNSKVTEGYFDDVCYATIWNAWYDYEYAIINGNTISYVFLQMMSESDIKLDSKYVPKNYDMDLGEKEFAIYNYMVN